MGKYLLKRILFSIFSLLVVVMVVMLLVFSLINRNVIFQMDDMWNKKTANDRVMYEYKQYQKYGYLNYTDYTSFVADKYKKSVGANYTSDENYQTDLKAIQKKDSYLQNATVQEFYQKFENESDYSIVYLEPLIYVGGRQDGKVKPGGEGHLLAVQEKNVVFRLWDYLKNFVSIETTNDVQDETLTDRYIRFEKDPYSGLFAVVGSGTRHKYLLYFDNRFPFIHQNFIRINLGISYTTYRDQEITTVMNTPTGDMVATRQQYPTMIGTDQYEDTAIDFHTLTYNTGILSDVDKKLFPDKYTVYEYNRSGLSYLENSFVIGLLAVIIAYIIGLPLGILMARKKDKLIDKIGNVYIIFIMAVPSLAYIFLFAGLMTSLFDLPYKFATAEVKFFAYILPTLSLSLTSIASLMKWMRRYMIDQMNSDYVKFARAEGLSEKEIFNTHISKNAFIYLVQSIPREILGCLTGAIITESVYGVPGVGRLLTTAISSHDNGIIVACTVFYTTLSIVSIILGDLLLAKYDPRISLSEEGGGGR